MKRRQLFTPRSFLQAQQVHSRHPGEGGELGEGEGADAVQAVLGIALPGDADLETRVGSEPFAPDLDEIGIGTEVGASREFERLPFAEIERSARPWPADSAQVK